MGHIISSRNKKHKTAVTLLDIEKAFDKVWRDGLIFKLIESGTSFQFVNTIKSFLADRSFHVRIGDHTSSEKNIKAEILQGSCFSQQLFSIIPHHPKTKIALFADDTLIYALRRSINCSSKKLQEHLDLLKLWFFDWKITVNAQNTKTTMFADKSTLGSGN